MGKLEIRDSVPADLNAIEVGVINSRIVGHVIFTKCGVAGRSINAALLGPLAVAPAWQRQGIGSELARAGLRQMKSMDAGVVCVLGDPAYYGRLGFLPETSVRPPFSLPAEYDGAWQSQELGSKTASYSGELSVPKQWLQPSLWMP